MAITTTARRSAKIIYYILLSLIVGRITGDPETWFSPGTVISLGKAIYGPDEIGADNLYDLYFYISVVIIFSITTTLFILTMTLARKLRRK